jgi:NADH-quinone oxidoreductase subunit K
MAEGELAILNGYLVVGTILFGLGVVGFVSRRNLITVFLAAELMLQGVSLSLIAWGRYHNDFGGQMLVHLIIAVAASEAAIALAVVLMLYQRQGSLDIALLQNLREENQPPYVDQELPEETPAETPAWPKLTPAGVPPKIPREETDYRPHV